MSAIDSYPGTVNQSSHRSRRVLPDRAGRDLECTCRRHWSVGSRLVLHPGISSTRDSRHHWISSPDWGSALRCIPERQRIVGSLRVYLCCFNVLLRCPLYQYRDLSRLLSSPETFSWTIICQDLEDLQRVLRKTPRGSPEWVGKEVWRIHNTSWQETSTSAQRVLS